MSITQVSTYVIEDGSITKEKMNLSAATSVAGQVLAIDGSDNFYFTDRFVEEEVDDRISALIAAGTHSNISIVYDDIANSLSFSATGAVSSVNGQTGAVVLDTDDISEGSKLYYADELARLSISITDAGGDGSLSYNSLTGVITYTGPSATEVRSHFTGGTGVTILNGEISIGQDVSPTANIVFNDLSTTGNITVDGDLTVNGTTTTITAQNLSISDNMIYLNNAGSATITNAVGNGSSVTYTANNNFNTGYTVDVTGITPSSFNVTDAIITSANSTSFTISSTVTDTYVSGGNARAHTNTNVDLGWAGSYNDGSYAHAGLFRDATDGVFKIFDGYIPEPDDSISIDTGHVSYNSASFLANNITAEGYVDATYFTGDGANLTGLFTNYSTTNLTEGTRLYFTDERAQDAVAGALVAGPNITIVYDDILNTITITGEVEDDLSNNTTDDLAEGTRKYFSDALARAAVSASGDISYNLATGEFSYTERTDSEIRNLFSADNDLIYDSANGVFSVITYKSTDFDTDFAAKTTDDLLEGTTKLYYTDLRARQSLTLVDNTGYVTFNDITGVITIDPPPDSATRSLFSGTDGIIYDSANGIFSLDTTYSPTFVDLILTGNLTVQGTTTTVDTENLLVSDNIVTLNSDVTGTPTENAGIEVERGTSTNVGIRWNETVDAWQFTNDGITYQNIGSLSASDTDDLIEGTTNLYFTDERAQDALGNIMVGGNNITFTYDDANNIMTIDGDISTTSDLPEGTRLYYTDARWDAKMALADTDDLLEGTRLYYTQTRADERVDVLRTELSGDGTGAVHFNNLTNVPTVTTQTITGTGAATYTLSNAPGSPAGIIVTLNGVTQEPTTDYTVSGTSITFSPALPNGQKALIRYVGYQISGGTIISATDSNLLDGLDSTQFLRSDTDDTMVGNLTMTGNIVPSANVTYSLGSANNRWNELWLSSSTVNIGNNALSSNVNNKPLWNTTEFVLSNVTMDLIPETDNTYDLGSQTKQFASVYGHTIEATYADLAERYEIDIQSEVGTVVVFGGDKEITPCQHEADISVAGVISTEPAFKMNSLAGNDNTHPFVALRGRVPCKVIGPVRKGDLMITSSTLGVAKSAGRNDMGHAVFAKSLVEDLSNDIKIIEVVII